MCVLVFLAYIAFAGRRFLTYLHIFQQEEYDGARFLRWIWERRGFDRKASAAVLTAGIVELLTDGPISTYVAPLVAVIGLLGVAAIERNPLKEAKKKLVLTARAKRILTVGTILLVALSISLVLFRAPLLIWTLVIQAVPLAMVVGNAMLQPYENLVQQSFWQDAHERLRELKPTVIALTGSFGKTSIKFIVGHILETQAPTLVTPGSINTPMGIARIVREQLTPRHRFFLCEMGAYGPGSIRRLCRLVPPSIGLITSVGYAHYERFKSLDTVGQTKFELAEAVLSNKGQIIVAAQVLEIPYARDFIARHRERITVVGRGEAADLKVVAIRQTPDGIETDLAGNDALLTLKAPLFGEHHGMNLALAFAAAKALGVASEDIVLSLSSMPQIEHRLEVIRQPDGGIIIDDAYNSNPVGFASALAVLDILRKNGGRRILITPGMVELGEAHEREHCNIGTLAARHVDVLLPIMSERIEGMISSYKAANPNGVVVACRSFADAKKWLSTNRRFDDVILLENDLPDLYELRLSL